MRRNKFTGGGIRKWKKMKQASLTVGNTITLFIGGLHLGAAGAALGTDIKDRNSDRFAGRIYPDRHCMALGKRGGLPDRRRDR